MPVGTSWRARRPDTPARRPDTAPRGAHARTTGGHHVRQAATRSTAEDAHRLAGGVRRQEGAREPQARLTARACGQRILEVADRPRSVTPSLSVFAQVPSQGVMASRDRDPFFARRVEPPEAPVDLGRHGGVPFRQQHLAEQNEARSLGFCVRAIADGHKHGLHDGRAEALRDAQCRGFSDSRSAPGVRGPRESCRGRHHRRRPVGG